jgi:hypothetical protein
MKKHGAINREEGREERGRREGREERSRMDEERGRNLSRNRSPSHSQSPTYRRGRSTPVGGSSSWYPGRRCFTLNLALYA